MPTKPFREAWILYITPDFTGYNQTDKPPPWVDQTAVDLSALTEMLASALFLRPDQIRIANDTIDQVSVAKRMDLFNGGANAIGFVDFGKALLREGRRQKGRTIDVTKAWKGLLGFANRAVIPPPNALAFVVETDDFEDMMFRRMNAQMALGMLEKHPMEAMMSGVHEEPAQGQLGQEARDTLKSQFGIAYEAPSLLEVAAHDPMPDWVEREREAVEKLFQR